MAHASRRWAALAALGVGLITIGLDTTVLSVALPTLAGDLHASTAELQWFSGAYTLALAAAVVPAGLLGDRYGPKRLLLAALAVFGAASATCAFAASPAVLIGARAVLGVAAAVMMALGLSVIDRTFPGPERGRAISAYATAMSLGLPLGPVLGGYLLQHFWWGSVFLINVPLAAAGLVALAVTLPTLPGTGAGRLDWVGVVLSSGALTMLCYGFVEAGGRGFTDPLVLGPLTGGLAVGVALVGHLRRSTRPLVDPALFRSRGFAAGSGLTTMVSFSLIGALFLLPQYFQTVLGSDAMRTGLQLLPIIGGLILGVQVADRLRPRFGATRVVAGGFGVLAAGFALGTITTAATGYGFAAGWVGLVGVGMGLTLPPAMDIAMGSLRGERSGVGSGVLQALRQVGATLGVAIGGTALNAGYRSHLDVGALPVTVADTISRSAAAGVAATQRTDSGPVLAAVRSAFVGGMAATLWVSVGLAVAGALLAAVFLPGQAADVAALADGGAGPGVAPAGIGPAPVPAGVAAATTGVAVAAAVRETTGAAAAGAGRAGPPEGGAAGASGAGPGGRTGAAGAAYSSGGTDGARPWT